MMWGWLRTAMGRRGPNLLHLRLPSDVALAAEEAEVGRAAGYCGWSSDDATMAEVELRMMDGSPVIEELLLKPQIRPLQVQRSSATPAPAAPPSNGIACKCQRLPAKKTNTRRIREDDKQSEVGNWVADFSSSEIGNWVADFSSSEVGNWVADFSSLEVGDRCRFQEISAQYLLTWKIN